MRSFIKYALVGAALAASGAASATVVNGVNGNGQMVLFVKNETTQAIYARGLNLFVDDFLTESQIVGDTYTGTTAAPDASFSYFLPASIGPDPKLSGFLNGTDTFSWTVMAGDSQGLLNVGTKRYVVTQQAAPAPTNGQINSSWVQINDIWNTLNTVLEGPDNSTDHDGQWDGPSGNAALIDTWFNAGGGSNKNALDTAANLYVAATGGTQTGATSRRYILGQLILTADGTLESVGAGPGGPEVPLPAAVWLLGSALVGLAGVGRRRRDAAKDSAVPA